MMTSRSTCIALILAAVTSAAAGFALYAGREQPVGFRTILFRDLDGLVPPRLPFCTGPVFADQRMLWATCQKRAAPSALAEGPWYLVRFDLERGAAEIRWTLPGGSSQRIEALARHPSGRLAALLRGGQVLVAHPGGGVSPVGRVPVTGTVAGLAWLGDDLEVIPGGHSDHGIHRLSAGRWTVRAAPWIEAPPGKIVRLVMAEHGPDGLVFTYVRSVEVPRTDMEVVTRFEDGREIAQQVNLPGGPEEGLYDMDRSPGNVVARSSTPSHRTVERAAGKWQVLAPAELIIESDYAIDGGRLVWIPREMGGPVRIDGRWLETTTHLLPIAGTTDLWALDYFHRDFMRVDRNLRPAEFMQASTVERCLAFAGLLVFPAVLVATIRSRRRRRTRGDDVVAVGDSDGEP